MNKKTDKRIAEMTAKLEKMENSEDTSSNNSEVSDVPVKNEEFTYPTSLSEISDDETLEAMKQQAIDVVKSHCFFASESTGSNFEYAGMILKKKKTGVYVIQESSFL